MGQRIDDYRNMLAQLQHEGVEQKPLGSNDQGQLVVREALKPPTGWTKFKAALSHVPLLGKIGSLRQARAQLADYPVQLQRYQVKSREIMTGFVQSLRQEFGDHVAEMATHNLDRTGNTSLTARSVKTVLENAEQAKKRIQNENRMQLTWFFDWPVQGGQPDPSQKAMVGLLQDRGYQKPDDAVSWKDFFRPDESGWLEAYIAKRVQERPAFSTGKIPNADIVKIAGEALDALRDLKSWGVEPQKLQALLGSSAKSTLGAQQMLYGLQKSALLACMKDQSKQDTELSPTQQKVAMQMTLDHEQALKLIDKSTALSPSQKEALRDIATRRPMDPSQVRAFEKTAKEFKEQLVALRGSIGTANTAQFGQALKSIMSKYGEAVTGIDSPPAELVGEMLEVGMADMTVEEKNSLYNELTSNGAGATLAKFCQSQGSDGPVVRGFCSMETIIRAVGKSAHLPQHVVDDGVRLMNVDPKNVPPSIQLLMIGSEQHATCVDQKSPHPDLVSKTYDGKAYREQKRAEWVQIVSESNIDQNGLSVSFNGDLGRGRFFLNGRQISDKGQTEPQDVEASTLEFLSAFTGKDGHVDMKLAKTVSCCCCQNGISFPMVEMMQTAVNGNLGGPSNTDYEVWRTDDGSWNIRCTTKKTATSFMPLEANVMEPKPLSQDSYMLASITYTVPAESIQQGNPRIELVDSRTFFSL